MNHCWLSSAAGCYALIPQRLETPHTFIWYVCSNSVAMNPPWGTSHTCPDQKMCRYSLRTAADHCSCQGRQYTAGDIGKASQAGVECAECSTTQNIQNNQHQCCFTQTIANLSKHVYLVVLPTAGSTDASPGGVGRAHVLQPCGKQQISAWHAQFAGQKAASCRAGLQHRQMQW